MITSVQNSKVKQWKKLKMRKERERENVFLIEGTHLVQEAASSDWVIQEIIIQDGTDIPEVLIGYERTEVSDNVFQAISDTKSPQGIAAVVEMKKDYTKEFNRVLLIDAVQDPGNLGTIIRTADAAGFDGVVLGDGTVDLYNDKVIRSTQGSIFHLPIYHKNLIDQISELKEGGFEVWASTLQNAVPYQELTVPDKIALIVGNEGSGIQKEIVEDASKNVHIPIFGGAESLNVSVATGILLYYIANH